MKKAIFFTALILLADATQAQWIASGESNYSVRTKLNWLKASADSTRTIQDSIIGGTKTITLSIDTVTTTSKLVVIDTAVQAEKATFKDSYLGNVATGNYVRIDTGGNLTMLGEAKQWVDVLIEPTVRSTGVLVPAFEKYFGDGGASIGCFLYSFTDAAI